MIEPPAHEGVHNKKGNAGLKKPSYFQFSCRVCSLTTKIYKKICRYLKKSTFQLFFELKG